MQKVFVCFTSNVHKAVIPLVRTVTFLSDSPFEKPPSPQQLEVPHPAPSTRSDIEVLT